MRAVPGTIENEGAQNMPDTIDVEARQGIAALRERIGAADKSLDEVWRAIDVLREIVNRSALDTRDLMHKIDAAVEAMKGQATATTSTTQALTDLTRRLTMLEQTREEEKAEDERRRNFVWKVLAPVAAAGTTLAVTLAQKVLGKLLPALF